MNLDCVEGSYQEAGLWKDSTGATGTLTGAIKIRHDAGKLEFIYGDRSRQVSNAIGSQDRPIGLHGTLGDGTLFLSDSSFTLEYEADVDGRVEYNTDTWISSDEGFWRAGVIRQHGRTIWFEAKMRKMDGGV